MPDPDLAAVELTRSGNQAAFEGLVRKYQAGVYGYVLRMCRNQADAEDLCQDSFVRAWAGLPRFRQESSFRTWLFRIATNLCLNRITRARRLEPVDENTAAPPADEPEESYQRRVRSRAIAAAIDALAPDQRSVLILSVYEEMSYRQIAASMGRSEASVSSLLYRARNAIRERLRSAREKGIV